MSRPFGSRSIVRMALGVDPIRTTRDLTDTEVELVAGLADAFAKAAELADAPAGLEVFDQAAEMALGEENWQRVRDAALKFSEGLTSEQQQADGEVTIADAPIATMSLAPRLGRLRAAGKCSDTEHAQQVRRLSLGQQQDVSRFIESREACPEGCMTGGVSERDASRIADEMLGG